MSTQHTTAFNFAKAIGYDSVGAAGFFTVSYIPLCVWYLWKSVRVPTYVHYMLAFFCTLRITAFSIRGVLAGSDSAGENLGLVIADEVLFGVGFFGLLYSAYILVLDREILLTSAADAEGQKQLKHPILQLTRNRRLFRLALLAGVVLGISGASMTSSDPKKANSTADKLHQASLSIFLVLTVLQTFQTLILAKLHLDTKYFRKRTEADNKFGMRHGVWILLVISTLLLVREAFSVSTMSDSMKQNEEKLWYPLIAVPEILAVCLYGIPGLVPSEYQLREN